jgi:hypothetical protein
MTEQLLLLLRNSSVLLFLCYASYLLCAALLVA